MKFSHLIFLLLFSSCAQVTSLNLKKHQFGKFPSKIVWIQVAGLSSEHLAMIKYSAPIGEKTTSFEQMVCTGHSWEYNLFKLRPSADAGFLSQLTGKKNIQSKCSDYDHKPIWKYIDSKGYSTGIFEGPIKTKDSLMSSKSCKKATDYLDDVTFWSMNKMPKSANSFHVSTEQNYKKSEVYYDKSCNSGDCFTTLSRNVEAVFKNFSKNKSNYLFIVRNFNYRDKLLSRNLKEAKEELLQVNETLNYFNKLSKDDEDLLVLVTTSEALEIDFPKTGREWKKYEQANKLKMVTNTKLISNVYAVGARAENFCGFYDQTDVLTRIFSGAKQQGLEFSIINPFN